MKLTTTPADDGFRMPAEFEPQSETYMVWPQRPDNWRNGGKPAQDAFTKLAAVISRYQPVTMLVNQSQFKHARKTLPNEVRVVEMSSNDSWMRDYGPFYIVDDKGGLRCVDFDFNAWGGLLDGLYFPWDKDNEIVAKIANLKYLDYYKVKTVLEGCAIHVDGEGTLIATEDVVLSEGRNAQATKAQMEKLFADYLGVTKTIWLKHGYFLDETNGDVDNMLNFVAPGELVLTWTNDEQDQQFKISQEAYTILSQATDAKGRPFKIHKLLMPAPQELSVEEANGVDAINGMLPRFAGQRLTATYVNYMTVNDAIIMPIFNDPNDQLAHDQLTKLYPDRQVVEFPAREILTGGGGLHTVAAGVPAGHSGGLLA